MHNDVHPSVKFQHIFVAPNGNLVPIKQSAAQLSPPHPWQLPVCFLSLDLPLVDTESHSRSPFVCGSFHVARCFPESNNVVTGISTSFLSMAK